MFSPSAIISALTLAVAASAHFTLDFPETRGFDEEIEPKFCGGFDKVGNRSQFPLGGGVLAIDSHHPSASVLVTIAINDAPTSFDQFNATKSAGSAGTVLPFFKIEGEGVHCFATNIEGLGIASAKDGVEATIQIQFDGGDGPLFQCADVTLSSSASATTPSTCPAVSPAPSVSSTATSTSTSSDSAASQTQTPGGSGTQLQVSAALLAAFAAFGGFLAL
ncbi:hypothetical protein EXIGLDRAFT_736705 [Exidia glandulosa HHB12029]|uniref:Copper acquisition factor BIM1-like domain-containing protein n=1 Tax=Exidia glandulosa HHB12029 TaxID=1314781 RepID=A0A165PC89_EXIGL|nr:hypothetical protein EXIGLDRAFT_736705 [Exidia glandulosa HHB12029]